MISVVTLTALLWAAPEPNAEEVARAKRLFDAGVAAFREGAYPVAISAFEEARRLAPVPAVTFSLAQAYRIQYFLDQDLEKLKRAVQLYEAYLADPGKGGRRDHAAQNLAAIRPVLERRLSEAPRGGAPTPNPGPKETILLLTSRQEGAQGAVGEGEWVDLPATFNVSAGTHQVRAQAPGCRPLSREALAIEGSVVSLEMSLEPLPATVVLVAPEGAVIRVDGRAEGEAPLPGALTLKEGPHTLSVSARGRTPWLRRITAEPGQAVELSADPAVSTQRKISYGVVAVAGGLAAAAGLAGGLAFEAQGRAQSLADLQGTRAFTPNEAEAYRLALDERAVRRDWAVGLSVSTGVALAVAAALWFFDEPRPEVGEELP